MIPGMGGNPRQLAMMMRKLGIDVEDIEGVEEVVVRTKTHEYRFAKASVSIMRAQGTETWQIVGKPAKAERGGTKPSTTPASTTAPAGQEPPIAASSAPAAPVQVSEDDVALVAKETGKSKAEARKALEATGGDLAEAIVRLS